MPPPTVEALHVPGIAAAQALGRTLVLVPHPDDETLGCGGLLVLLAQAGLAVRVVLVSDGAASHPGSRSHPPAVLSALRLREMGAALAELGCDAQPFTALHLPDGAVPTRGGAGYLAAFERLARLTRGFRPDSVVLPSRHDAHPDHRASHALGMAAVRRSAPWARTLEYRVWPAVARPAAEPAAEDGQAPRDAACAVWQINVTQVAAQKQRALAHHRSQLGQVVFDDPQGFMLPAALIAACAHPVETYHCFSPEHIHEHYP
jgi:LmbE family N-acetylglucosaminyl deacetylase